jgi:hypothetical protein
MINKGKHPFCNTMGNINVSKVLSGTYDKLETAKYSKDLKEIIFLMMNPVNIFYYICYYILILF